MSASKSKKLSTLSLVDLAIKELKEYSRQGMAPHDAWNQSSVFLIKAAQAHARYFVADCFVRSTRNGKFSPPVRSILAQLCELLLIYWLAERSGDFFMVCYLKRLVKCVLLYLFDFVSIAVTVFRVESQRIGAVSSKVHGVTWRNSNLCGQSCRFF